MSDYRPRPATANWHPFNLLSFALLSRHLRRVNKRPALLLARLTLHTGARIQEIRYAQWGNINLDARIWTIPPEGHGVTPRFIPLSDSAARVLRALQGESGDDDPLIPGGTMVRFKELRDQTRMCGAFGTSFVSLRDEALRRMADRIGFHECCLAMGYKPTGNVPAALLKTRKQKKYEIGLRIF